MGAVHFIASIGNHGDDAACGIWEPARMSGEWTHVTCGACKRSNRYRHAQAGDQILLMTAYRKPRDLDQILAADALASSPDTHPAQGRVG